MPATNRLFSEIPPDVFDREWRTSHDAVFSGRDAISGAFREPRWEAVVLPYGQLIEERDFNALAAAIAGSGDRDLVITTQEDLRPPAPACLIPVSFASLNSVWRAPNVLSAVETHIFSRSARWGVVCTIDDYTLIAGQPEFMEVFAEGLDGRAAIKRRFLEFSAGLLERNFRRRVLELAGWTPDEPPGDA